MTNFRERFADIYVIFLTVHQSVSPILNRISLNFEVLKDILCESVYSQEILIQFANRLAKRVDSLLLPSFVKPTQKQLVRVYLL